MGGKKGVWPTARGMDRCYSGDECTNGRLERPGYGENLFIQLLKVDNGLMTYNKSKCINIGCSSVLIFVHCPVTVVRWAAILIK